MERRSKRTYVRWEQGDKTGGLAADMQAEVSLVVGIYKV